MPHASHTLATQLHLQTGTLASDRRRRSDTIRRELALLGLRPTWSPSSARWVNKWDSFMNVIKSQVREREAGQQVSPQTGCAATVRGPLVAGDRQCWKEAAGCRKTSRAVPREPQVFYQPDPRDSELLCTDKPEVLAREDGRGILSISSRSGWRVGTSADCSDF